MKDEPRQKRRMAPSAVQRRYAPAILPKEDALPRARRGVITMTDLRDHDADLGDHDRPILVIAMDRSE